MFEVVLSTPVQSVQLYNSRGGCKRHAAFSGLLGPKDTVVINMQRMALPVVLTAEGTTFRLTHNSSKHVLRIVTTSSSLDCVLTHFWLSVALNGNKPLHTSLSIGAPWPLGFLLCEQGPQFTPYLH